VTLGRIRATSRWWMRATAVIAMLCLSLALAPLASASSSSARVRALQAFHYHRALLAHSRDRPRFTRFSYGRHQRHAKSPRARAAVVGGTEVSIQQVPWQVTVFGEFEFNGKKYAVLCGGAILDASHIVTAGHCAFNPATKEPNPAANFVVLAGVSQLSEKEILEGPTREARLVTGVRIHPYFNYKAGPGTADDVSVLTLEVPLKPTLAVKPIGLPSATLPPAEGAALRLSGYGVENSNTKELNGKLYALDTTLISPQRCGGEANALFLCATTGGGTACNGDSGGPVTNGPSPTLVGVIDFGEVLEGHLCFAGAVDGFVNLAAPEVHAFIEGNEAPPLAPRGGGSAAISGTALAGNALTCEAGSWSNGPTFAYAFIDSASGGVLQEGSSSYALTSADVGRRIYCRVQASNAGGTGIARTGTTGPVKLTLSKPTVSSVAPNKGPGAGGTTVTITGSGFEKGATTVTIGYEATSVKLISPTELTAQTPSHPAGESEVVVSNSNGASSGGPQFTYFVPTVSSVNPSSGPTAGGTTVTIKGSGFEKGATTVNIGSAATNVEVISPTELSATTSPNTAGPYEVVVSDNIGTSGGGPSFTYIAPPPSNESSGGKTETGGAQGGTGSGTPSGGVLGSTAASVSPGQIESLLRQLLSHTAKIAALLKSGLALTVSAPEAGVAVINWYQVPPGAKLARAKAKPVLVASGQASFSAAGTARLKLKLTAAGRRLLKSAKSFKLTAKGIFTPTGQAPVSVRKSLTLKR
jgi:Trypsin/IPT/TIG domain